MKLITKSSQMKFYGQRAHADQLDVLEQCVVFSGLGVIRMFKIPRRFFNDVKSFRF